MREEPEGVPTLLEFREEFDRVNAKYFNGLIPHYRLAWNHRLRKTGGRIIYNRKTIEFSSWLMWYGDNAKDAFRTLHHEMIHGYLDAIGHNSGHTPEFKDLLKKMGHGRIIYHSMNRPENKRNTAYSGPRDSVAFYCRVCSMTTVSSFDTDWMRFDYLSEYIHSEDRIRCKECKDPVIILNGRGYYTSGKAIITALGHSNLAEYVPNMVFVTEQS